MAYDAFVGSPSLLTAPFERAFAITPANADLPTVTRAIYVGGAGDIVGILKHDDTQVTFVGVPAGSLLPGRFKRILPATSAANLVGLY